MNSTSRGWVGALLLASVAASASPLAEIEAWALESADTLNMAALERDIAQQKLRIVEAETGAHWTLGASLGHYQEPQSDTSARSYAALQGTAGLRIPVLGEAEAAQRQVDAARTLVQVADLQGTLQRERVVHDVRLAYIAYVRNAEKADVARAWLGLEAASTPVFLARTRAHALLEVDRLALQSGFHVARRDLDRYQLAMQSALAVLRRVSKHPLDGLAPEPPTWATPCVQRETLLQRLGARPVLARKQAELEARARQAGLWRWGGMEAGITLQQSLVQDLGGQSGQGTVLGFDMRMPFDSGGVNRAHTSAAALQLQQARLDLETTRAEETEALDQVLGTLHNSQSDLQRGRQRLAESLEADRIAMLRLGSLDGEVLEKALMARYALYQSAIDQVETRQRADGAQIDALVYGAACAEHAAMPDAEAQADAPAALLARLAWPIQVTPVPLDLAWFAWRADALLAPQALDLPAASGHLLVSFTAEQLSLLQADAALAETLRQRLDDVHQRGWTVDLLMGDARYVLPTGRARLLQQLQAMAGFAFDGINLDLERSGLPPSQQARWWDLLRPTLRAVHAASPWPITLTTHFRELDDRSHQAELQQAGVRSVMAMVYVGDVADTITIARRVLARQAPLGVAVVQSVEPQLPATESSFASGRAANWQRWQSIAMRLSDLPNFQGIAVQSLEDFRAMKP